MAFPVLLILLAQPLAAKVSLSDEDLKKKAFAYATMLGHPMNPAETSLRRGGPGRPASDTRITVSDAWVIIQLNPDGTLQAYANSDPKSIKKNNSAGRLTDDQMWKSAEKLIAKLGAPSALLRTEMGGRAPAAKGLVEATPMFFHPKPYGYLSDGGNMAYVKLRRTDGVPLEVIIGKGWTYEKPNIKVKLTQAQATLSRSTGDPAGKIRGDLRWFVNAGPDAPTYFQKLGNSRTMRLCYVLGGPKGGGVVDSVTGQIVKKFEMHRH